MADAKVTALLERVFIFLEDGEWQKADEYCEKVLDIEPKNAEAYLGKLMAEMKIKDRNELKNCSKPLENNVNYNKVILFGDEQLVSDIKFAAETTQNIFENKRRNKTKLIKTGIAFVAVIIVLAFVLNSFVIPSVKMKSQYKEALEHAKGGNIQQAICILTELGNYKDSAELLKDLRYDFAPKDVISAYNQTVAIKSDGTVVAIGYNWDGQSNVSDWSNIVSVSAGNFNTVGLKSDGTVVATEITSNWDYGQSNVGGWTDIIAVSAGNIHTLGLRGDGKVVFAGFSDDGRCDVSDWTDIVAISAGGGHSVGLKSDGTVVAVGHNSYNQCDVEDWTDIIAVSAGEAHTVGLKSDGTVVATEYADHYFVSQSGVNYWTDIVAISAGHNFTVGLKSDGTVVATGVNNSMQTNVYNWTNVVAISAGGGQALGLKSDGTLYCTDGYAPKPDILNWKNIKIPNNKS